MTNTIGTSTIGRDDPADYEARAERDREHLGILRVCAARALADSGAWEELPELLPRGRYRIDTSNPTTHRVFRLEQNDVWNSGGYVINRSDASRKHYFRVVANDTVCVFFSHVADETPPEPTKRRRLRRVK